MEVATSATREIALNDGLVTVVDADLYDFLSQWKWHAKKASNTWYASRSTSRKDPAPRRTVDMHRVVVCLSDSDARVVDHRDRNGLNNTRENLRVCTVHQNTCHSYRPVGSSGYRGVYWVPATGRWWAMLRHFGKTVGLGCYDDPAEAAAVYDEAVVRLRGEFAVTNTMLASHYSNPVNHENL